MNKRESQKRETRRRILESAARLFRERGFSATGVDAVMEGAGLTAGGFYAHFDSKDELLQECLEEAFRQSRGRLTAGLSGAPAAMARQVLKRYLSREHRDRAGEGCPIVGIASELGRQTGRMPKLVAGHLEAVIAGLGKLGLSRRRAIVEMSRAVGALLMSRQVKGEPLSDEILRSVRS